MAYNRRSADQTALCELKSVKAEADDERAFSPIKEEREETPPSPREATEI